MVRGKASAVGSLPEIRLAIPLEVEGEKPSLGVRVVA